MVYQGYVTNILPLKIAQYNAPAHYNLKKQLCSLHLNSNIFIFNLARKKYYTQVQTDN